MNLSPKLMSGEYMLLERQWVNRPPDVQKLFVPVRVDAGCIMYRYAQAPRYTGRLFDVGGLDPTDIDDEFKILVNRFMMAIREGLSTNLVTADEDDDFSYGAFCTAVATCGFDQDDWLLSPIAGAIYQIQLIDSIQTEED